MDIDGHTMFVVVSLFGLGTWMQNLSLSLSLSLSLYNILFVRLVYTAVDITDCYVRLIRAL